MARWKLLHFTTGTPSRSTSAVAALRGRGARSQAFVLPRIAFTVAPIPFRPGQVLQPHGRLAETTSPRGSTTSRPGRAKIHVPRRRSRDPRGLPRGNQAALRRPGDRALAGGNHRQPAHHPGFYDVALRDFRPLLGALTLARLAWSYDTPRSDRS